MTDLVLKHGLCFADLYDREGLVCLDRAFVAHLTRTDIGLHDRLMAARRNPEAIERLDESNLFVDLAPYLEGTGASIPRNYRNTTGTRR
jgi:hypothetical protein